jgi:hypothetical protein
MGGKEPRIRELIKVGDPVFRVELQLKVLDALMGAGRVGRVVGCVYWDALYDAPQRREAL